MSGVEGRLIEYEKIRRQKPVEGRLTPQQMLVMREATRPVQERELVLKWGLHPASLSRTIRGLVSKGSLRRMIDRNDGRRRSLQTTTKGKKMLVQMDAKLDELFSQGQPPSPASEKAVQHSARRRSRRIRPAQGQLAMDFPLG